MKIQSVYSCAIERRWRRQRSNGTLKQGSGYALAQVAFIQRIVKFVRHQISALAHNDRIFGQHGLTPFSLPDGRLGDAGSDPFFADTVDALQA